MSVIVKNSLDNEHRAFIKGSPEKIKELSNPGSLPANFDEICE